MTNAQVLGPLQNLKRTNEIMKCCLLELCGSKQSMSIILSLMKYGLVCVAVGLQGLSSS